MKSKMIVENKYTKKVVEGKKKLVITLDFYLLSDKLSRIYLFTQRYSKGVFEYFEHGRSSAE